MELTQNCEIITNSPFTCCRESEFEGFKVLDGVWSKMIMLSMDTGAQHYLMQQGEDIQKQQVLFTKRS